MSQNCLASVIKMQCFRVRLNVIETNWLRSNSMKKYIVLAALFFSIGMSGISHAQIVAGDISEYMWGIPDPNDPSWHHCPKRSGAFEKWRRFCDNYPRPQCPSGPSICGTAPCWTQDNKTYWTEGHEGFSTCFTTCGCQGGGGIGGGSNGGS